MRKTNKKNVLVFCGMVVLGLSLSSCAGDEEAQQEELEQSDELVEYTDEFGEQVVDDSANLDSEGPEAMELGEPIEDPMAVELGAADGEAVAEIGEGGLEEVADMQAGEIEGESIEAESFSYTIVKGDWLSKIAQRVYGDMYKWPLIANANTQIENPNLIYPDTVIMVPIIDEKSREFSRSYANIEPLEMQQKYVSIEIKKGDTLSKIAKRLLGNSGAWRDLWTANKLKISNPDQLSVGELIKIPVNQNYKNNKKRIAKL